MPRTARIDQPGILQHVMVRGIERSPIFLDDRDRVFFLERLSRLLAESGTALLAWALLTNHLHLLLRPADEPLRTLMERLLTAHALRFNRRHKRAGHLFQNRYRSLVCEEQDYLLELVRYLHLNPLRAGLAPTLEALDRYPWSGHAVLMGHGRMSGQATDEVMGMFGAPPSAARMHYRKFVAQGIPFGRRPELVGQFDPLNPAREQTLPCTLKVLGSESFLRSLQEKAPPDEVFPQSLSLKSLQLRVAKEFGVDPVALLFRARGNEVAKARAVFCLLAVRRLGYPAAEVGRFLGMGGWAVGKAIRRGAAEENRTATGGDRVVLIP